MDKSYPVYAYCSIDAFMNIITSESIWCSSAEFMNDPFDCRAYNNAVDAWFVESDLDIIVKNGVRDTYNLRYFGFIPFISCFSLGRDTLSQWRGYADDGKGFAIGFGADEIRTQIENLSRVAPKSGKDIAFKGIAEEVKYTNENITEIVSDKLSLVRGHNRNENYHILSKLKLEAALVKQPSFHEEREFRVAILTNALNFDNDLTNGLISRLKFRKGINGLIVPYYELRFPMPKEIIIGPKNESQVEDIYLFLNNVEKTVDTKWWKFEKDQITKSELTLR